MKRVLVKYRWIIGGAALLIAVAVGWFIRRSEILQSVYVVKRGTFDKIIETKGEIHGKNAINITLDDIFKDNDLQVWEYSIKDMVPEGTIVKKGEWVATLDQVNLNQRLQINREQMDMRQAQLNDAKIDSALTLSEIRQRIAQLEFDLQYRQLDLEQSKFESPAYQRKMQTAFNQTMRQIERQKRDYELRKMDLEARTGRNEERYNFHRDVDLKLQQALAATTINAPEAGMVIYARVRGNRKIRIGDEVGPWRPIIATLPDLSVLISETYIAEIDIAKVKTGDSARVTVDALPGLTYHGRVTTIANIGQELQGADTRVFAVTIELNHHDQKLLPGMTSNNQIIVEQLPDQIIIPRSCLFSEEGQPFVYLKKEGKLWKHKVSTGPENDDVVVITGGLEEKERILNHPPAPDEKVESFTE